MNFFQPRGYYRGYRSRGQYRGRGRGNFSRGAYVSTGSQLTDFYPTAVSSENKDLAVIGLQQSVKKVSINNYSVEAQYDNGTPSGCPNLLWVPTTWASKALFGCFWLGSNKRRSLDDVEIAINLFMVATLLAVRAGYTGINQLVGHRFRDWIENLFAFMRVGNHYNVLLLLLIDAFQGVASCDYLFGITGNLGKYKKDRNQIFEKAAEKARHCGTWFVEISSRLVGTVAPSVFGYLNRGYECSGLSADGTKGNAKRIRQNLGNGRGRGRRNQRKGQKKRSGLGNWQPDAEFDDDQENIENGDDGDKIADL